MKMNCQASVSLLEGERLDDLQNGLYVIQNPRYFCFGTDAVLLANFAAVRSGERACDLGTGCGVIPLLLSARTKGRRLVGIELQHEIAHMAQRSVLLNNLTTVEIYEMDMKNAAAHFGVASFDCVTCNPPYIRSGSGLKPVSDAQRIARTEDCATLRDCVSAASLLLRNGGRAYFIHQSDRLFEIWQLMDEFSLAPKRAKLIHPNEKKPPNLVLVEGVKNGNPGIMWLPPLFVF